MTLFKKIVAAIFMVLSTIAVIVLIIALFGSWVVKNRMETITVDLLLSGENVIAVTVDGLDRVDGLLHESTEIVDEVDTRVQEIGSGIQEADLRVDRLLQSLGVQLTPKIESAASSFAQIEANIVAINDTVDAIREIPMLNMDTRLPSTSKLQEVEDGITQTRENVAQLTEAIENQRTDIIDGKVSGIMDVTSGVRDKLHTTREDLDDAGVRLEESAQSMVELRERIPGLYTMITIMLNILILLTILAFISLFIHSWDFFKCPEDGLSGLMPGDCEKAPA